MQKAAGSRAIFLVYTSFATFCSLIALGAMLLSPSEPGSAVLLGLSPARLVLAMGFLAGFLFFALLFWKAFRDPDWANRAVEQWFGAGPFSRALAWFAGIGFGLGWLGCFLPSYRAGILAPHWDRIQPLAIFLLIVSAATLAVFLVRRIVLSGRQQALPGTYRLGFVLFLISLLVFGWMLYGKYGIFSPQEDFWYGAGVPILASQLILAVLGGVLFLLAGWNWSAGRKDLIVVLLLYAVTAVLWAREPLLKSFLFSEPRPPNEALYPFADAAAFDAGSQFALIGQGIYIFNSVFNDRPLYLSLLVYLHSLAGQNYSLLMAAQAAIFAVISPLVYLIGRSLNLRAVGFTTAIVAMLRGVNSIAASNMIDTANPKMILSDFPAAIGVALIILFACEWLKAPEKKWHYAIWAGGAIGLTLMIRPHALVLLMFLPFLAIPRFAPEWKKWLLACALIGLGVIAVTLPWEIRNVSRGGIMYRSVVVKIQDVIRTRYLIPAGQGTLAPSGNELSVLTYRYADTLSLLLPRTGLVQQQACSSPICFTPNHFLHNAFTSMLILPTSPVLHDLQHTVKGDNLYWRADWDGSFTPVSLSFFVVNLFLITLGISVAWKGQHLPGLVPLAIFAMYALSNSVARTSGGRYIVPMDWILTFYFMAGLLFLFTEATRMTSWRQLSLFDAENRENGTVPSTWKKAGLALLVLLIAGLVVPLSEKLHAPRYTDFNIPGILQEQESRISESGLDLEQLNRFLESPGAEVLLGRTLYPRSYRMGQGEVSFYFYPFTIMDFPRTGFFLIGPHGLDNILLPGETPDYLPHAADALVIGCRGQNYVDALMVIVLDDRGAVYRRSPEVELACPMKQPVCRNNNNCE